MARLDKTLARPAKPGRFVEAWKPTIARAAMRAREGLSRKRPSISPWLHSLWLIVTLVGASSGLGRISTSPPRHEANWARAVQIGGPQISHTRLLFWVEKLGFITTGGVSSGAFSRQWPRGSTDSAGMYSKDNLRLPLYYLVAALLLNCWEFRRLPRRCLLPGRSVLRPFRPQSSTPVPF